MQANNVAGVWLRLSASGVADWTSILAEFRQTLAPPGEFTEKAQSFIARLGALVGVCAALIELRDGNTPEWGHYHWSGCPHLIGSADPACRRLLVPQGYAHFPLMSDGNDLGSLMVAFPAETGLAAEQRSILETAASLVAAAVLKDYLFHSLRVHTELLGRVGPGPAEAAVVVLTGRDQVEEVRTLLRRGPASRLPQEAATRMIDAAGESPPYALYEPLTHQEQVVLRLLAQGLHNKEIRDRLGLSLKTVAFHAGNIYGKLGVDSRLAAVARARELGIVAPP